MAADGSKDKLSRRTNTAVLEWSTDPVVRYYQSFSRGFKETDAPTFIDHLFFKLPWIEEAEESVADAMALPSGARAEHCVKASGGTRASKTAFQRAMVRKYPPFRDKDGLHLRYAYVQLPAVPSPSAIDLSILMALGDPSWKICRGPVDRLRRIGETSELVGLCALGLDDFQHLVDSRGKRVQHATLDRLKEIGERINVPFVFTGLARMQKAFETNEQSQGRAESTVNFRRLNWTVKSERDYFKSIVRQVIAVFDANLGKSEFDPLNEGNLFRLYVSVGGLIGNLMRVLRVAARICIKQKTRLTVLAVRMAVIKVIASSANWPNRIDPFDDAFVSVVSPETLEIANRIGSGEGPDAIGSRKAA